MKKLKIIIELTRSKNGYETCCRKLQLYGYGETVEDALWSLSEDYKRQESFFSRAAKGDLSKKGLVYQRRFKKMEIKDAKNND